MTLFISCIAKYVNIIVGRYGIICIINADCASFVCVDVVFAVKVKIII